MVMCALAIVAGGCATVYPTPIPGPADVGTGLRAPETPEARAEAVLDATAEACLERPALCDEREADVLGRLAWQYPDVQVPDSVRRFPTNLPQEVRTLGFTVGVSLSEQVATLERGNTLTYPGDVDP